MSRPAIIMCPPSPARRIVSTVLVLAAVTLLAASAASADSFKPIGGGWQTYVNARFGASFDFPAQIFTPGEPPATGDGLRFAAPDATLELYAWRNTGSETARSLKSRLNGTQGYANVTYSPAGRDWLVLSGFRGANIFYEKYFFRNGMVTGFGMEFPKSRKPRYAPIVERIEDSFHAGHTDQASR